MEYKLGEYSLFRKIGELSRILFVPIEENGYKPKFLNSRILFYSVVLIVVLKIIFLVIFLPFPKNFFFADITKIDIVNLLNRNRVEMGLRPLRENEKLNQAAMFKARDMIQKGYFSHQSPQGTLPWFWFGQANYNYKYAGENLAVGFSDSNNLYDAWLNSPSHKANLLNSKYEEVGSAVVEGFGEGNAVLVVQMFGSPSQIKKQGTENKQQETEGSEQKTEDKEQKTEIMQIISDKSEEDNSATIKANGNGQVLAQTDFSAGKTNNNDFRKQFINFAVYDAERILRGLSLILLTVVGVSMIIGIVIKFGIQHNDMLLRGLVSMAILWLSSFIGKDAIASLLPYQVTI